VVIVSSNYFNSGPSQKYVVVPYDAHTKKWKVSRIQHIDRASFWKVHDHGRPVFVSKERLASISQEIKTLFGFQ
jgi:hypothetical protein